MAAGAAGLATVAIVRAPAKAAQFEFKCGSQLPLEHPSSVRLTQMWAAIERESGGRLRTQFFPNSLLGSDQAMLSQVREGALQFLSTSPGALAGVVTIAGISDLGYAFKDQAEAVRVMDGPLGGYLRDDAATKGLHVFRTIWGSGMKEIGSNSHPIRTPEDLRGFKIKAVGMIAIDLFKELGASPNPLSLAETYTGLQTRLIDGEDGPLVIIETARFYEVIKYASLTDHAYSALWVMANADVWKSLPPDLQEIVERNNAKYAKLEWRDTDLVAMSVSDKLQRQGVTINRVDQAPFRTRLRGYYQAWATRFGPRAWGLLESSLGHRLA
jgi:TRAP-type transport system periplasmic protein